MWQWRKECSKKVKKGKNLDVNVGAAAISKTASVGTKQHQTVQNSSP